MRNVNLTLSETLRGLFAHPFTAASAVVHLAAAATAFSLALCQLNTLTHCYRNVAVVVMTAYCNLSTWVLCSSTTPLTSFARIAYTRSD